MPAGLAQGQDPPVVFIAQLGTGGQSWKPVVERLTSHPTTVVYDRPGTGEAPPRPAPNPPLPYSAMADELAALLDGLGVTGPAVLVGHSIGSLIARVYAARYPQRVTGMVHVDGSMPRRFVVAGWGGGADGDGPDATQLDTVAGEVEVLTAAALQVPAVVVAASPDCWSEDVPHPAVPDLWMLHQRCLAEHARTALVVANNASHQIPAEAPELVAYAVDAVVEAARERTGVNLDLDRLNSVGGRVDRIWASS